MTIQKLASEIAKREGKKSQARIGDIREILKILCTIDAEEAVEKPGGDPTVLLVLGKESSKIEGQILKRREREEKKAKK